jgi:hypothetical protein
VTSIAAWAGVDSRGLSSLYIASDSRISWTGPPRPSWDQGRKVFACYSKPHIFGYWGEVLFPALALPVVVDRIDRGFLADAGQDGNASIYQAIRRLWEGYPADQDFSLVHGLRIGDNMNSRFSLSVMACRAGTWSTRSFDMPDRSTLLLSEGSGKWAVRKAYREWQKSHSANTSRAVFSAFCESITSHSDSYTGGAPQLAGLYRIGSGRLFGIVHAGQRYFAGAVLTGAEQLDGVEWRNNLFEIADGKTKRRLSGTQAHEPR